MSQPAITVKVTKYGDRRHWIMYYDDPVTSRRVTRSTKQTTEKAAEKVAAKWEDDLQNGRFRAASKFTWESFRLRYEAEVLPSLAGNTRRVITSVFSAIERICRPEKLSSLTADRLSFFQSELRRGDPAAKREAVSEATVRTYLAHLRSAMKWAADLGFIHEVPKMKMPKRAKGSKMMKGRPITGEEFERMLVKVEAGLLAAATKNKPKRPARTTLPAEYAASRAQDRCDAAIAAAPSWRRLLRGLWLSGLRLGEALNLYWDRTDRLHVDLSGRRPMFRIRAELEKGNQDRILPMTPDFAEFLAETPPEERRGPIFSPIAASNGRPNRDLVWVSKVISAIGEAAVVKVDTNPISGKVKFASAHDLRRSFGARWAPRVMPVVLQELMRHESISTTLRYYVGQNAEATADAIWAAAEKVTPPQSGKGEPCESSTESSTVS